MFGDTKALTEGDEVRRPELRHLEEVVVSIRDTRQSPTWGLPSASLATVMALWLRQAVV